MFRRIRPLSAARRTRIGDPLPTPHPCHDRPSCVIVRDRVTGRYWRDPYLIRPTAGDPRSDWSRRRHAHVFTSSDVAAYLVATSGIADRVDLVIVDPPPNARNRKRVSCIRFHYLYRTTIAVYKYRPAAEQMFDWPTPGISALSAVSTYNLDRDLHAQPRPKPQPAISIHRHTGTDKSCHFQ